ncbi:MAG: methylmalonyl-CoA mutase, partial [Candidatus Kapaibacterium sp.]
FSTPEEVAKQCIENDVHIVGISTLAAGHKTLIPRLVELLKEYGREDILVIAGGVIPKQDYDFLFKNGVFKVFGPGIKITDSSKEIIIELIKRHS